MLTEQVEHHHQTDTKPGVIGIEEGGDDRDEHRFHQHQPWCIVDMVNEENNNQPKEQGENDIMAALVAQQLPRYLCDNGRHQQRQHVSPDVPSMMIPLNYQEGKDGKGQAANAPHRFVKPSITHPQLLVEDVIGDVVDGHGDHGDYLQRTAAEKSVKHKIVLHLLIVSWYDITVTVLNQDTLQVPFLRRFSYSSISCQEVGQRTSPSDGRNFPDFQSEMMGCASA